MPDVTRCLERFYLHDRQRLLTRLTGDTPLPGDALVRRLCALGEVPLPDGPGWLALDYRMDWLHAALQVACDGASDDVEYEDDGRLAGKREDESVDLLVAVRSGRETYLFLVVLPRRAETDALRLGAIAERAREIVDERTTVLGVHVLLVYVSGALPPGARGLPWALLAPPPDPDVRLRIQRDAIDSLDATVTGAWRVSWGRQRTVAI